VLVKKNEMNKIKEYIIESYKELSQKVTWPTWQELQKSAVVVLVASVLIAVILLVMDLASNKILDAYYSL
jgi:preprotein translocase subunit SecE